MILIQITKKGNSVNLIFDNEEIIKVPYELYVQLALYKNDQITEAQLSKLNKKIELYKIKQSSFRYLLGRNHSKNELKLKLIKKGFEIDLIDIVIEDLERIEFLNDKDFTYQFYKTSLKKKKGIRKIKSELFRKGVERTIIEEVGINFLEDPVLLESAISLSSRKLNSIKYKNYSTTQLKQKVFSFLSQRGFSSDIIKESLTQLEIN